MEGENDFMQRVNPILAELVAEELSKESINLSKNYLLLLFKLISKLTLRKSLKPSMIERLLQRLFEMQKVIGELMFSDEAFPSFLKYILKNQERAYVRERIDAEGLRSGKFKLSKPK